MVNRPAEEPGHALENAFDDDPKTWFRSVRNQAVRTGAHEWTIGFGERKLVDGIELAPRNDQHWKHGQVRDYEVYLGDSNGEWGEPVARGRLRLAQGAQRIEFPARAGRLLGLRYVWGGNSTSAGMDCSAYVSWVWGVGRFTTDSIWQVSHFITKDELRPGDAVNLTIARDPRRTGHIRLFEAWANEARTLMWVYEETPPRAVHRVDDPALRWRAAGRCAGGSSGTRTTDRRRAPP